MENINILETDNIIFTKVSTKLIDEYLELVNDKSIQKLGFSEYIRENNVKEENGKLVDDIYLRLEL